MDACEIGEEDLPPGEEGDVVLFFHPASVQVNDWHDRGESDAALDGTIAAVEKGEATMTTTIGEMIDDKQSAMSDSLKDSRIDEFIEFFTQFGCFPVEYDEEYAVQLFDERDALPEGSPERLAVAYKIFDFTFSDGRRP